MANFIDERFIAEIKRCADIYHMQCCDVCEIVFVNYMREISERLGYIEEWCKDHTK